MLRENMPSLSRIADRRAIVIVVVFCIAAGVLPIVFAAVLSFCSLDPNGAFHFGSLDGYRALVGGGRLGEVRKILLRSAVVTLVTMFIAVPAAFWVARVRRKGIQTIILVILVAPWLVSDMLRAFGWQLLLSPDGPVGTALSFVLGVDHSLNLRYRFSAVLFGLVSSMLPAGVLSVLAAIPDRDRTEWLAAAELGRPRHTFALMAFGRARLGVFLGACFVFVLSSFSSAEARFLDGPTQTSVQTVAASLANDGVPSLLAFGSALVGFVLLACVAAVSAYFLLARPVRPRKRGERAPTPQAPLSLECSGNHAIVTIFAATLDAAARYLPPCAVFTAAVLCSSPLLAVSVEAFRQLGPAGMHWTFGNFQLMLSSDQLVQALLNSLGVAAAVALIATTMAFLLSLVVWDRAMQRWVVVVLTSLVLLPGDSYAISLFQMLKVFGRAQGGWALVVLAHVLWSVPFATGTLVLANRRLGVHTLQAALEYGNGPIEVIIRFVGRINLGRIAGVAALAGTLSLNEYVRSSYLGASLVTVSNEVHGRLTSGLLPENRGVFAAEFLIVGVSIIAVIMTIALLQSKRLPALSARVPPSSVGGRGNYIDPGDNVETPLGHRLG